MQQSTNKIAILDKGWIELQDFMGDDLSIVNAARVSFLGESKGEHSDKALLFYLMTHQHSTPFEQVEFKFRVKAPLFVARQWMRHRTWSYNEVSRRYTSTKMDFYTPTVWRLQSGENKQGSLGFLTDDNQIALSNAQFERHMNDSLSLYKSMIDRGIAREMARMILPQNMYTQFVAKVNARNLMSFLKLRLHEDAQYEIRLYAIELNNFLAQVLPWTHKAFNKYLM